MKKCLLIAAIITLIGGCGRTPPSHFYVLTGLSHHPVQRTGKPQDIGIGPVTLPKYLDTPQIITRASNNKLLLNEYHRWAEDLDDNVTRVVGDNLLAMIAKSRVFYYPWRHNTTVDYQVMMDIRRFEMDQCNNCILKASYSIYKGDGHKLLLVRNKTYTLKGKSDNDYQEIAALMSKNLLAMSRDVVKDILQ